MVEKIGDFILELVPAPGTGTFTTGTPVAGRLGFAAGVTAGWFVSPAPVFYFADDTTKAEWGIGTYNAGANTLSRDTVLWTTAGSTAKLNFTVGGLPVYLYPEIPAGRTVYRDPTTGGLIAPYDISSPTQNGGPLAGNRNRLLNSSFGQNQRVFVSGAALLAGVFGFDRWKAGAGGCTMTFATAGGGANVITITAGTLIQNMEAKALPEGGTYTLSWQGTATARIDAGAYAASPITVTGLAAAATHLVEFNTGTVSFPQFEPGPMASQWEFRHYQVELQTCYSYFVAGNFNYAGYGAAGATEALTINLPTSMRGAPTLAVTPTTQTNCGTTTLTSVDNKTLRLATVITALGSYALIGSFTATTEL